jgi:hypothetical protein
MPTLASLTARALSLALRVADRGSRISAAQRTPGGTAKPPPAPNHGSESVASEESEPLAIVDYTTCGHNGWNIQERGTLIIKAESDRIYAWYHDVCVMGLNWVGTSELTRIGPGQLGQAPTNRVGRKRSAAGLNSSA